MHAYYTHNGHIYNDIPVHVYYGSNINNRKVTFKAKHNKIHLNLSIALLLGLIVFVSGIETAKHDRVSSNLLLRMYVHLHACHSHEHTHAYTHTYA